MASSSAQVARPPSQSQLSERERRAAGRVELERTFEIGANLGLAARNLYFSRNPMLRWVVRKRHRKIIDILSQSPRPGIVLDFGIGWGTLLPALASLASSVKGVDIDPSNLRWARTLCEAMAITNVSLISVTPESPLSGVDTGSVDAIVAADVLEHVANLSGVLDEFDRILVPDGLVAVSVPTENALYHAAQWIMRREEGEDHHIQDPRQIEALVGKKFDIRHRQSLLGFFHVITCAKKKQ